MKYTDFLKAFPDERSALDLIYGVVLGDTIRCPHCGSDKIHHRRDLPKNFLCKSCNNHFSGLRGTLFENTSTDLRRWLYGIYGHQKGFLKTIVKFKEETGVTYKTAWRLMACIRRSHDKQEKKILEEIFEKIEKTIARTTQQ